MVNTSQQIGGSLGTALLSTIAYNASTNYAITNKIAKNDMVGQAFAATNGFTTAFRFSAGLLFVGAIVLFFFINIGKEAVVETEGAGMH
jgi:hypothetical protein